MCFVSNVYSSAVGHYSATSLYLSLYENFILMCNKAHWKNALIDSVMEVYKQKKYLFLGSVIEVYKQKKY